jgi:cellulose synthase operon protein C
MAALMAAGLLAACFSDSPETLIASAKTSLEKKDNKAALIFLKNALQENPSSGEARYLLGKVMLASGDAAGASIELDKARELKYGSDELTAASAQALLMLGQFDKVLTQFGKTQLASIEAEVALNTTLASAALASAKNAEARLYVDQALKLKPEDLRVRLVEVRMVAGMDGADAALRALDQVLVKNPASSEAWQLKGALLSSSRKDLDSAIAAFKASLKHDKTNTAAHIGLVTVQLSRRDLEAVKLALADFKAAYPAHPQLKLLTANYALEIGDLKVARENAQALLKQAPQDGRVQLLAGSIEFRQGALVAAENHLSKALLAAPESSRVRLLLARTHLRAGEPSKAMTAIQPLLAASSPDPDALAIAAEAQTQLGDSKHAEDLFARAAQLNPKDIRSRTALALTQIEKGQYEQGIGTLRTIAASDTGVSADLALVAMLSRKGDFDQATKAVEVLERKTQNKSLAPSLRGQLELLHGNKDKAREQFELALATDPVYLPAARSLAALDMADRKPDVAIKRFEKVLAADQANVWVRMAIIELKAKTGSSKQELEGLLMATIKQSPEAAAPRVELARLYLQDRNFKAAMALLQEGLATQSDNVDLLAQMGQVQAASGDINQALVTLNKVVTLQPSSPVPLMRLAEFQMFRKDVPAATQSLKRALAVKANYIPAQTALVRIHMASGRNAEAYALVRSVQTQRPREGVGFALEGEIALLENKFDRAAAAFRTSLERQPTSETAIRLHQALAAGSSKSEAVALEKRWREAHPKDAAFTFYLGDAALARADNASALQYYQSVLEAQPDNALAANNAAWLLYTLKKPGAQEYAEKANRLSPNRAPFMDTLAEILANTGQLERALDLQKKAVALSPELHMHRLHLAKYYLQAGQKTAAREELNKLAELGDKFKAQAEVRKLMEQS